MNIRYLIFAAFPLLFLTQSAFTEEALIQRHTRLSAEMSAWARLCDSPCVLPEKFLDGGSGASFIFAAIKLTLLQKSVKVIGSDYCSSACAVLVDKMKAFGADVCVQNGMKLRFHRAFALEPNADGSRALLDSTPSVAVAEVANWIDSQGGIPEDGSWIVIPESVVSKYYGYCR